MSDLKPRPFCGDSCDCLWAEDCRHCTDLDELEDLGQQKLFGDSEDFQGDSSAPPAGHTEEE